MKLINEIFYWITEGLLIPILLILIGFLFQSLIVIGRFLKVAQQKKKTHQLMKSKTIVVFSNWEFEKNDDFFDALRELNATKNEVVKAKIIDDYESLCEKKLSQPRMLAKIGPMLGLMLTLIPMGPALVGLANGDIASMAQHLQLAFSTTVIGVFVGGIGYAVQLKTATWFKEELNFLQFQMNIMEEKISYEEEHHY